MSILIKGMEMPKSCGECLDIGWHYVFDCRLDDAEEGERLPNCPLVPVPPHGRLIDADALVRDNGIKEIPEYHEVVLAAPTIIPASEEHTMEEFMYRQEGNPNDGSM